MKLIILRRVSVFSLVFAVLLISLSTFSTESNTEAIQTQEALLIEVSPVIVNVAVAQNQNFERLVYSFSPSFDMEKPINIAVVQNQNFERLACSF